MEFERSELNIDGVKTVLLSAGRGTPLVFLHGAGTLAGFDFAKGWADRYRVIVPYHPGFGESGDYPQLDSVQDLVLHYLGLFDALELSEINLVGFSLGGYIAANFAIQHSHRLRKLVLAAPAGLRDEEHPTVDMLAVRPEDIPRLLTAKPENYLRRLPPNANGDPGVMASRYREATTLARLMWDRPTDRKLARYMHRIACPTLLVWGDADQAVPYQQSRIWRERLRNADVRLFEGAGHLVLEEDARAVEAVADFLS